MSHDLDGHPIEDLAASADSLRDRKTEPRVALLDEVIGLEEIKAELRSQIKLWAEPERLERLRRQASRRVHLFRATRHREGQRSATPAAAPGTADAHRHRIRRVDG